MTQQQSEVFLSAQRSEDASRAYNLSQMLDFRGQLDTSVLLTAISRVGQKHDALRTTFYGPSLVACVNQEFRGDIQCFDLSSLSSDLTQAEIEKFKEEERQHAFDLTFGPLFRARLIRLAEHHHLLVLTLHHIVGDGWSMRLLAEGIAQEYNTQIGGETSQSTDDFQLTDYNRSQRTFRNSDKFSKAEDYWLNNLEGNIPNLDLPLSHNRSSVRTYNSKRASLAIDEKLLGEIQGFASHSNCSLYSFALSIYLAFLHRITEQNDIVVGLPYAGQVDLGKFSLLGHCVNMLPIRCGVNGDMPFEEFLVQVKESVSNAQQFGQITFGELLDRVDLDRSPERAPLVSTTFNLIGELSSLDFAGLDSCEVSLFERAYETFDVAVHLVQSDDGIEVLADFNSDLFDMETMDRWLSSYVGMLSAAVKAPDLLISELPILSQRDNELLAQWNQTEQDYPSDQCLHSLIGQQSTKTPSSVAVSFEEVSYTYEELDRRSSCLANFLIEKGVGPDVLVGLCVERSAEMLVALLGILKAGGGYLPLDPEYPQDRIEYILDNAQAPLLISQDSLLPSMPSHAGETISLDGDWTKIESCSSELPKTSPETEVQPDNLAYVIYTSGSTGKPKGVQVTHRNAVNFLCSMQQEPGLTAKDKLLAVTTISFDIAVLELYMPLISGAHVDIASREMTLDAQALSRRIEVQEITMVQATPATWRMLLDYGWQPGRKIKALVGGEALPKDIVPGLLENTSELWNMYGPTETTVWSTCYQVTDADAPILIGKPIANTQLYVLDPHGQPTPVGVPGELYIGGDGVTRDYLKRPELNEKAFVEDPYHQRSGMNLYRTGDQVKLTSSGDLQYITRLDNQVKVRGFRIELGEIESVLSSHGSIKQAVVMVREDSPGDVRLAGYYVVFPEAGEPGVQELRAHLQQSLPGYMIPQHLMLLEGMPLTPNGKVDRKKLPTPVVDDLAVSIVEPRNDFEGSILSVWRKLLGTSDIGITDDFFENGGHSLLAVKAVADMGKATGLEFDVGLMFEHATVAGLVEALGSEAEQQSSNVVLLNEVKVDEGEKKPPLFLLCGVDIYRDLAASIVDRDVYGVYVFAELAIARDAVVGKVSEISFPNLCDAYLDAISRISPNSSVLVGGVSFGGFVAFEVARRLKDQPNQDVERILLLDTILPSGYSKSYRKYLAYSFSHPIISARKICKKIFGKSKARTTKTLSPSNGQEQAVVLREKAFTELMGRHEQTLEISSDAVILFRAAENNVEPWVEFKEDLGWKKFAPNSLAVIEVPGTHLGVLSGAGAEKIANFLVS